MKKTSFNDFEFVRTLGKGAFSTVYLVKRKRDQKLYALKSIIMEKLKESEQQNSVNEIRILASISHQNVIGYKEAFWNEKNKTLNIVMEYCDNGDLETKIKNMKRNKERFEESLIWNYAIQIIKGLKALHDKKILHRDLKSANIFLTKDNICKIGDLNVSKVMKDKYLMNTQIGTPIYSSPEIWQNNPYSYKSDLWSVGCIIYEMCCLRPPFKGKNYDELGDNICKGKIEKISSRYSVELWNMIKKLLEVDVNKRFDCDTILHDDSIKDQLSELSSLNFDSNNFKEDDSSSVLDTIEYKNLIDLKKKIPNITKYDSFKKIKNKNSNNEESSNNIYIVENNDETIKNDCSFEELSISEHKPINNMTINDSHINNNNVIFARNTIQYNNNIFKKIKKEGTFNNPFNRTKKCKSFTFINFNDLNFDIYFDELELKMNKSQEIINNKIILSNNINKKLRKLNFIKCKEKKNQKKYKTVKKEKNNHPVYDGNFLSNKIISFPIKSGLMNLKEDIARKNSQLDLPINSSMKKINKPMPKNSNSNPKLLRKKNMKLNSSKNTKINEENLYKKTFKKSLFNSNDNEIKEKAQIAKNSDDLSKIVRKVKKINKIKNNAIRQNKTGNIVSNNIDTKKNKKINENSNSIIKNSLTVLNENKTIKEKNNIQNNSNINKVNTSYEQTIKKMKNISDKTLTNHIQEVIENKNNINKERLLKSNKYVHKYLGNSKIIEIDLSNINNKNSNKNLQSFKNESRNTNFMKFSSQEIKFSKFNCNLKNKRLSTKNNNISKIGSKLLKFGDN